MTIRELLAEESPTLRRRLASLFSGLPERPRIWFLYHIFPGKGMVLGKEGKKKNFFLTFYRIHI